MGMIFQQLDVILILNFNYDSAKTLYLLGRKAMNWMSELEKAVVALIDVFHRYSGKEGDKHKLKKSELKELINNELSHFLEEIKEQEVVDKVMETLDNDGDGECDFQEFMAFVAMVTTACHEFFEHE